MGIRFPNRRKLRKKLRRIGSILSDMASFPWIKPVILVALSLCILLILAPYIIGKFYSDSNRSSDNSADTPSFETVQVPDAINVYRTASGKAESIDFEDYIKGVVSSEMPSSFHEEALKAQSVAARTYSTARVLKAEASGNPQDHPAAPLCDSTHCQVYQSEEELEQVKGKEWMDSGWKKVCKAVDDTESELLYYNGKLVEQALFHSSSGGRTENSEDVFAAAVPYLVSVESPYEDEATHQNETHSFSIKELSSILRSAYPKTNFGNINGSNIKILSRSAGGRVDKMQIGSAVLAGRQIREALSLPSAKFNIHIQDNNVTFTSNGSGHGVGLSQYGADGMAKAGYGYKKILSHYYSGVEVHQSRRNNRTEFLRNLHE